MRRIMAAACLLAACGGASAERIKDIVDVKGVRGNPLWGYGLVIGLDGTGDNSTASVRALTNMLRRENLVFSPSDLSSKNIASVIVTAQLGPFDRRGSVIDVTVSTIGNAKSLRGGKLLMTELRGADREVYVVAQGSLAVGGFSASGTNASVQKGHTTVGRIPGGGHVEKEEIATVVENGEIMMLLRNSDFATASRIAEVVNKHYPDSSHAADAKAVRIRVPKDVTKDKIAGFVHSIGALEVRVDTPAVVIINERTGTVVVGQNVGISRVVISQGSLSVVVEERKSVSQPEPFARRGDTEVTTETSVRTVEGASKLEVLPGQVSVAELAGALNALGLTPTDLVSIFQGIKDAGALQAKLVIK